MEPIKEGISKICKECLRDLPIDNFVKNRPNTESRKKVCKECNKKYNKVYRSKNKDKISEYRRKYTKRNKKKIKETQKEWYDRTRPIRLEKSKQYKLTHKEQEKNRKIEYIKKHPIKTKRARKKYTQANKDKIRIKDKEWRRKNKAKMKEYGSKWRAKNRKRLRIKGKKYARANRHKLSIRAKKYREENGTHINMLRNKKYHSFYKHNPSYRIRKNLGVRLCAIVKQQNTTKSSNTMSLIGCSLKELKNHLQKQFREGMTWDNYGKYGWHIDHIKPCAAFDLSNPKDQQKCFHYSNLRPLWWNENLSKGPTFRGKRHRAKCDSVEIKS